ncbi:hypothetical protein QTO02_18765, partial [Vibrio fortis]
VASYNKTVSLSSVRYHGQIFLLENSQALSTAGENKEWQWEYCVVGFCFHRKCAPKNKNVSNTKLSVIREDWL